MPRVLGAGGVAAAAYHQQLFARLGYVGIASLGGLFQLVNVARCSQERLQLRLTHGGKLIGHPADLQALLGEAVLSVVVVTVTLRAADDITVALRGIVANAHQLQPQAHTAQVHLLTIGVIDLGWTAYDTHARQWP